MPFLQASWDELDVLMLDLVQSRHYTASVMMSLALIE